MVKSLLNSNNRSLLNFKYIIKFLFADNTGCFTKGYRKLNHYETYIYKNIPMRLLQNGHHTNKFLSTEFPNRTPYI